MSPGTRYRSGRSRLLTAARSPRVAAWGTGLAALVVAVTVATGAVATGIDKRRVAGVTVSNGPEPAVCQAGLCTVTWTVRVSSGPVTLQRFVLRGLGLGAAEDGRRLQSVTLDSRSLDLPSPQERFVRDRVDAIIRPYATLEAGSTSTLRATVVVPPVCPDGGLPPVLGEVTMSSGGAIDQHEDDPVELPCSG